MASLHFMALPFLPSLHLGQSEKDVDVKRRPRAIRRVATSHLISCHSTIFSRERSPFPGANMADMKGNEEGRPGA